MYTIEESEYGFNLNVPLPFAKREDLSLLRSGDELTVQVGGWRRSLILPRSLRGLEIGQARFEDETLIILFETQRKEVDDG